MRRAGLVVYLWSSHLITDQPGLDLLLPLTLAVQQLLDGNVIWVQEVSNGNFNWVKIEAVTTLLLHDFSLLSNAGHSEVDYSTSQMKSPLNTDPTVEADQLGESRLF